MDKVWIVYEIATENKQAFFTKFSWLFYSSNRSIAFIIFTPFCSTGKNKSPFFSILSKALKIVKSVGLSPFLTSIHSNGIETVAPSLGRTLYTHIGGASCRERMYTPV